MNETVEVTCLKGCVLAIVGEGEKLVACPLVCSPGFSRFLHALTA
jgi:phage-related protein